jgi:hypothetical protein
MISVNSRGTTTLSINQKFSTNSKSSKPLLSDCLIGRSSPCCYTTKCDTVEGGLMERASEGNWAGKEANLTLSCNLGNVGRNG